MRSKQAVGPSRTIILTGGGTAGHVCAHLALLKELHTEGWRVAYLGRRSGLEGRLLEDQNEVLFLPIAAGKLRRYFSWAHFGDVFRTLWGVVQSLWWIGRLRPVLVLSRGGYVSFPPTVAAWCFRVPVVLLEADVSPGLAVRVSFPLLSCVLYSFEQTRSFLPPSLDSHKVSLPLRKEVLCGDRQRALQLCGWSQDPELPVLLVMGGSQGSRFLEELMLQSLDEVLQSFYVIYLAGTAGAESHSAWQRALNEVASSRAHRVIRLNYVFRDMGHVYELADVALSRGGANSLFELLACCLPTLVVPLQRGSRGEQVENARALEEQGLVRVITEQDLSSPEVLQRELSALTQHRESLSAAMASHKDRLRSGVQQVMAELSEISPRNGQKINA